MTAFAPPPGERPRRRTGAAAPVPSSPKGAGRPLAASRLAPRGRALSPVRSVTLGLLAGAMLAALPAIYGLASREAQRGDPALGRVPLAQAFGSALETDAPALQQRGSEELQLAAVRRARVTAEALEPPPPPTPDERELDPVAVGSEGEDAEATAELWPHAQSAQDLSPQQGFRMEPAAAGAPAPMLPAGGTPFRDNAVPTPAAAGHAPEIAIVIDDCGLDRPHTRRAAELPAPLTLSFMPYAGELAAQTRFARAQGHELMLHMPMQPMGAADPGPNPITVDLADAEIVRRLDAALAAVPNIVAVNNHMGSRATADARVMGTVTHELARLGYGFLDSRTSGQALGLEAAQALGMPRAARDVFLDHEMTPEFVAQSLAKVERVARARGYAVAIGHPHAVTLEALQTWLPQAKARGFVLVPISTIMARELASGARPVAAAAAAHGSHNAAGGGG